MSNGQDTVYLKDGRKMAGEITNITTKRIVLNSKGIIYSFKKTGISDYYRKSDHLPVVEVPEKVPVDYSYHSSDSLIKKNIVKFSPFGFLFNRMTFRYERLFSKLNSLEIGSGFSMSDTKFSLINSQWPGTGYFFQAAVKTYFPKANKTDISGFYFKPEFLFSFIYYPDIQYRVDSYSHHGQLHSMSVYSINETHKNSAMMFNFGYQFKIGKRLYFDISSGIGIGDNKTATSDPVKINNSGIGLGPKEEYFPVNALSHYYLLNDNGRQLYVMNMNFSLGYCF